MKIIFDDIIYSLQKSGGISVYWRILEDFLPAEKRLVYKNRKFNIFYTERDGEVEVKRSLLFERYKSVFLKSIMENNTKFIFHSSYYRFCKNKEAVNITTIHDFTYELFRSDLKGLFHKIQKKNTVMHSDGVICISENTKRDLYRYYPNYKGKVQVIYHGYDKTLYNFTDKKLENRSNNVLFVGSRALYKGFELTVRLISEIPQLNLKIIGGGDLTESEIQLMEKLIPNQYEKLGFISNGDLAKLYNESFALFYPSEYEGFGFPVIEAQACGCPVICQKKSSIPEVSGDKCIYIDSANFDESINAIKRLFASDYYSLLQKEGLENVKRFSWEKCIKETMEFYNSVLNL